MAKMRQGALLEGLSGTLGNAVVVRYRDGSVHVRQRVSPRDPGTPLQTAARERLTRVARLFRSLTPEEALAWQEFARREAALAEAQGLRPDPRPQSAFVRLATKLLQADPQADPPRLPPANAFVGDSPILGATAVPGAVRFQASAPNAPGIVTELLLQPLRTSLSRPDPEKFRAQAFAAFAPGGLARVVPAGPGWHAPAYRFVLSATGQSSPLVVLPPVAVP